MPGSEETIFRALALRQLEPPVGDFIKDCLKVRSLKQLVDPRVNILDEENHDRALGYAARAIGTDPKAESEAAKITQAWNDHPDHNVCKAMVLERSTLFSSRSSFGVETLIKDNLWDISRDEQIHVATNSLVS